MWLFTQHGFYSIVADRKLPGRHMIRARVRLDLENLKKLAGITEAIQVTPDADYKYRLSIEAATLIRLMNVLANTVDYPNFKGRIGQRPDQAGRSATYHRIWAEAATMQSTTPS